MAIINPGSGMSGNYIRKKSVLPKPFDFDSVGDGADSHLLLQNESTILEIDNDAMLLNGSMVWHDSDLARIETVLELPEIRDDINKRATRGWVNTPDDWRVAIVGNNDTVSYALNVDLNEVNTLNGVTGNIQNQLDEHTSSLQTVNTDIDTINTDIGTINTEINTINTALDKRAVRGWVNTPDEWKVAIVGANDTISYSLSASLTELGYLAGVTGSIQDQLDDKQSQIDTHTSSLETVNTKLDKKQDMSWVNTPTELRVAFIDSNGKLTYSAIISSAELGALNNISGNIQNQLNNRVVNSSTQPLLVSAYDTNEGTQIDPTGPNLVFKGQAYISGGGAFRSLNESNLGSSSQRWDTVYYNTLNSSSDRRLKQILEYPTELLDVWFEYVKPECFVYHDKPDEKRFGIVAQDVISAFEAAGLDWRDYRVVLIDDKSEYYGVDYDQIQNIEMAAIRRRMGV